MSCKGVLGWVRDSKGKVLNRPFKSIFNCVTTMVGGGHSDEDGLGNTTNYVVDIYEI